MERREIATLGELRVIGSGGEGTVYAHASDSSTVVKRYHGRAATLMLDGLLRQVHTLNAGFRAYVQQRCCLPTAIIEEAGKAVGILMPSIPDEFQFSPGDGSRHLRELQHLLFDHALKRLGESPPTDVQLLELCRQWACTMSALHQANIIIGDVSPKNWLWTVHPSPGVYLIDCDSYRVRNCAPVLPQKQTPDWDDPKLPPGAQANMESDAYKLALLCCRVLLRDSRIRPGTALQRLHGGDRPALAWMTPLLEQVESGADRRPKPPEWADALARASGQDVDGSASNEPTSAARAVEGRQRPTLDLGSGRPTPTGPAAAEAEPRSRPTLDLCQPTNRHLSTAQERS